MLLLATVFATGSLGTRTDRAVAQATLFLASAQADTGEACTMIRKLGRGVINIPWAWPEGAMKMMNAEKIIKRLDSSEIGG